LQQESEQLVRAGGREFLALEEPLHGGGHAVKAELPHSFKRLLMIHTSWIF